MRDKRFTPDVLSRFWAKVDKPDNDQDCWPWTAGKTKGYGMFCIGRDALPRMAQAHRVSFALHHNIELSEVPPLLRHTCDNPSCVNPHHLLEGTHKENTQDMYERNRHHVIGSGASNPSAKLSLDDAIKIKDLLTLGLSCSQIGRQFNVSHVTVSNIKLGKSWKDMPL